MGPPWVPGPLSFEYLREFISHQSLFTKQSYAYTLTCLCNSFFFALRYITHFPFLRYIYEQDASFDRSVAPRQRQPLAPLHGPGPRLPGLNACT